MSKEETNKDSFDEVETTDKEQSPVENTVEEQENTSLAEVLQALRAVEAKSDALAEENRRLRQEKGEEVNDEVQDRKPAETVTLASYNDMPIVDMKLEKNLEIDHNGKTYTKNYKAICQVYGQKEPVEITYGEMGEPNDFLNLPRKTYKLVNQNSSDLSGASRIEHNKVMSRGDKVDEVDRSEGAPVRTGKKIELVTRNDIRYYTIQVGDETVELHQDKIYR